MQTSFPLDSLVRNEMVASIAGARGRIPRVSRNQRKAGYVFCAGQNVSLVVKEDQASHAVARSLIGVTPIIRRKTLLPILPSRKEEDSNRT
jgi:hypothetical protein